MQYDEAMKRLSFGIPTEHIAQAAGVSEAEMRHTSVQPTTTELAASSGSTGVGTRSASPEVSEGPGARGGSRSALTTCCPGHRSP